MEPREIIKSILVNQQNRNKWIFEVPDSDEYTGGDFTVYINFLGKKIKYQICHTNNIGSYTDEELEHSELVKFVWDEIDSWIERQLEIQEDDEDAEKFVDEDGNILDDKYYSYFLEDYLNILETMFYDDEYFKDDIIDFVIEHYNDIYKNAA